MNESSAVLKIFSSLNYGNEEVHEYISEKNYKKDMLNKVEPYLRKNLSSGYILGKENINLYYEKFIVKNAKANIVICHGFGEFTEKYNELIYYFMRAGYSVFIIEHRGQGRSQRLGIDSSQISVDKFDYYVEDFKKFIDEIVLPESKNKGIFLFAHSMGGGIGTIFLEEYKNYFKAAVLSSPMHEINTGKPPKILANIVSAGLKLCGKGTMYLPGQSPYTGKKNFPNRSTSSKERYDYQYEKIKNNSAYHSGGSSALWYYESFRATKKLIKKENASKVTIPVLLFQAEYDTHVIPEAHNKFAKYAKNCKVVQLKGAKHGSYFERDEIMFSFINQVLSFYKNNL